MIRKETPCHGCTRSTPTCHSTCEEYKAFDVENRRENQLYRQAKDKEAVSIGYVVSNSVKIHKKKGEIKMEAKTDKQIEEMANEINEMDEPNAHYYDETLQDHEAFADCFTIAKHLYEKGYRKASDVAREIFKEIDELFEADENDFDVCYDEAKNEIDNEVLLALENYVHGIRKMIAELKKKYTEDER